MITCCKSTWGLSWGWCWCWTMAGAITLPSIGADIWKRLIWWSSSASLYRRAGNNHDAAAWWMTGGHTEKTESKRLCTAMVTWYHYSLVASWLTPQQCQQNERVWVSLSDDCFSCLTWVSSTRSPCFSSTYLRRWVNPEQSIYKAQRGKQSSKKWQILSGLYSLSNSRYKRWCAQQAIVFTRLYTYKTDIQWPKNGSMWCNCLWLRRCLYWTCLFVADTEFDNRNQKYRKHCKWRLWKRSWIYSNRPTQRCYHCQGRCPSSLIYFRWSYELLFTSSAILEMNCC